ncbi:MAG: helix-turn-helix domain-containing protein [Blautia sp.]|nr:helix-turn-helix domain-containing protein [Blautia sp.]
MAKAGRKGKYEYWLSEEGLALVEGWARNGLTNKQIAQNIGINESTLCDWANKFSEFSNAIKTSKEVADIQVENALHKRATGYKYTETVEELRFDKATGEYKLTVVKQTTKEMPPDTVAQIFWLRNRKPKDWRNDPEKAHAIDDQKADDGFIDALNGTAAEDWEDESS